MKLLLIKLCFFIALLVSFSACEEDIMEFSSGDNSVYFEERLDTIQKSFITTSEDFINYDLGILALGTIGKKDRTFAISVNEGEGHDSVAVEGTDFEILTKEFVIPAGEIKSSISIKIIKNEYLKTSRRYLYLKIKETDDFEVGDINNSSLTVDINDFGVKPAYWPIEYGNYDEAVLRVFFLITGYSDFPNVEDFDRNSSPESAYYLTTIVPDAMRKYLKANEVYDKDGNRIFL